MDLVQAIWLSSVSGAGLFFGAGAMVRRAIDGPRREADGAGARAAEERIAALEHAGQRAAVRLAEAEAKAAELAASLEAESQRRAIDGNEIARLNMLVDRQQVEAIQLRAAAGRAADAKPQSDEAPRLRAVVLAHSREIERLRAATSKAEGELAAATAARAAREADLGRARSELSAQAGELRSARAALAAASQHASEAARLRDENGALRVEIEALEKERGASRALADLQQKNQQLGLRARALEQRGAELGKKAAEADELRSRVKTLEGVELEAAGLRARVATLEARGLADRLVESAARAPVTSRPDVPVSAREQRLEAALERHLQAIARAEPGCSAAVLTDHNGLLVAASPGASLRDELGAAASLATATVERVRLMLPIAGPRAVEIIDENRVVLRTRWLDAGGDVLLVTTLGVAPEGALVRSDAERAIVSRLSECT